VNSKSNQTYTITPNAGFVVALLVVDGAVLPGATTYTFTNVTTDHYINAYFAPSDLTLTAGAGDNGSITPAGLTGVSQGGSLTYTITPNTGFMVAVLVVDGTLLPGATSYTFTNVTTDHYINAYFSQVSPPVTITAAAGPDGAISPAGIATVAVGTNQTYTITPNSGFTVALLVVDGTLLPGATTYTFTNVTENHYINAYFAPSGFTISAGAGANGSISPAGISAVTPGGNITYTITPNAGFIVSVLVVDGALVPGATTYTFTNVTTDHYVNAYFEPSGLNVSAAAGPNGNISPAGLTSVTPGNNLTYTITPDSGHTVSVLVVDGTLLPGAATYTFTNVTSSHYINAYFQ